MVRDFAKIQIQVVDNILQAPIFHDIVFYFQQMVGGGILKGFLVDFPQGQWSTVRT